MPNQNSKINASPRHGGFFGGNRAPVPGEKPKNFKNSFGKLIRYMGKYKILFILVFIFAICSTIFTIVGPKILGMATTKLFEGIVSNVSGTGSGIDFGYISVIMIILISLYGVSLLFGYLQGHLMSTISMKVTYKLRKDISNKMYRLPFKYYDGTSNGEILSYITNDIDTISQSLNQSVTQMITSITTIIGILIMMLTISWEMTLVALAIIPISMGIMVLIMKKSQKHFTAQQTYLGHVNGHVEEMYASHIVIKAFNKEEESAKTFDKYNKILYTSAWKSQFMSGLMMPIILFIGNLGYVGICILGGYLSVTTGLPVGNIQAFVQYVRQFTQPISQVANISNILQQTAAAAERVFDFLEQEEEIPESKNPITIQHDENKILTHPCIKPKGQVTFNHVHFGYTEERIIINDFSVVVQPGQKVAIVGPTGAGKTTIVKLLMRFYDVNDGAILIDGHDIRNYTRKDLRSLFGMVVQDTWLYNASIEDNIRYSKLNASTEEVIAAAKAAQVDHFVRTCPDGYKTILNEEASNVSQGQKQLLTIARAILANPEILILDEATSSVDTRTEILIQKAMDHLMQGRTSFVIAHRLSTIKNADTILVMKDGDIVEQGNHEELLDKGGFYAGLYNSQFDEGEE